MILQSYNLKDWNNPHTLQCFFIRVLSLPGDQGEQLSDDIKRVDRLGERWVDALFQVSPDADEEEQLTEGGQDGVVIVQVKLKE